jgi:hypothetical protein
MKRLWRPWCRLTHHHYGRPALDLKNWRAVWRCTRCDVKFSRSFGRDQRVVLDWDELRKRYNAEVLIPLPELPKENHG